MVEDSYSSYKIDYDTQVKDIINLEGRQNCITISKVMAILLKGWIFPVGGVAKRI